jgi:hypothetical protein
MTAGARTIASDKQFWHRYVDVYRAAFGALGPVSDVLEFGVAEGHSIRWLADCFAQTRIVGADLTPEQPGWPQDERIRYVQVDQGDRRAVAAMFAGLGRRYDVIIEDGSHVPSHQATCLVEGLGFLRPGGLYILEDVHTSHPDNADFRSCTPPGGANCLHVLLALQHFADCGQSMTGALAASLATPGFFSAEEVRFLAEEIASIALYKRTSLPLRCYRCGSSAFDYPRLKCGCGADLYAAADSMSFLLRRRATPTGAGPASG